MSCIPLWFAAICYRLGEVKGRKEKVRMASTDRLQVTLHIPKTSTTTSALPLSRLGHHQVIQAIPIKDATVDDLKAIDDGTFFKDGCGSRRH
jgi:hypothetical protein